MRAEVKRNLKLSLAHKLIVGGALAFALREEITRRGNGIAEQAINGVALREEAKVFGGVVRRFALNDCLHFNIAVYGAGDNGFAHARRLTEGGDLSKEK